MSQKTLETNGDDGSWLTSAVDWILYSLPVELSQPIYSAQLSFNDTSQIEKLQNTFRTKTPGVFVIITQLFCFAN